MQPKDVIELSGVSKKYHLYDAPGDRLREFLSPRGRKLHREHWAIREVSLKVRRGETFCIVGENGSGKSTLLKLMVGILQPSGGQVDIRGRVTALLELGSGFNPEFTGRQNVFLNGAILGFAARDVSSKLDRILEFAEIGAYIDQPVKTYSSGMVVRLAFAVAVHMDPDILIVDEALAVGDIYFRQRCMRKIHELRSHGVTIVYVTHDVADVKALGDRALWLHRGGAMEIGDAREVAVKYLAWLVRKDSEHQRMDAGAARPVGAPLPSAEVVSRFSEHVLRHGEGGAEILGIQACDERDRPVSEIGTPCRLAVRISARAAQEVALPIVGVNIRREGVDFSGSNTLRENVQLPPMKPGDILTVDFHFHLPEMAAARLTLTPGVGDGTLLEFRIHDIVEDAIDVRVLPGPSPPYGYMSIPCVSVTTTRH
jgi:ABC-type polysaccharide/polyol phosphate transport system ATPase subunit